MNPKPLAAVIFAASLLAACAAPNGARTDLYGSPAPPEAATRTIVIFPNTRWVNVTGGEIVRFIVGDRIFTWNFNASSVVNNFDLTEVAPPGVFDHPVQAYLAPDPRYIGGGGGHGHGHGGAFR